MGGGGKGATVGVVPLLLGLVEFLDEEAVEADAWEFADDAAAAGDGCVRIIIGGGGGGGGNTGLAGDPPPAVRDDDDAPPLPYVVAEDC